MSSTTIFNKQIPAFRKALNDYVKVAESDENAEIRNQINSLNSERERWKAGIKTPPTGYYDVSQFEAFINYDTKIKALEKKISNSKIEKLKEVIKKYMASFPNNSLAFPPYVFKLKSDGVLDITPLKLS